MEQMSSLALQVLQAWLIEQTQQTEKALQKGIDYLKKRIRSSSLVVIFLAASMVVPMAVEHSNKEQAALNRPTVFFAFATFISALSLCGLVADEFLHPTPGPCRYVAIKALVHLYAAFLVSLSFSLSLMMRNMNVAATSLALAASAALVAWRLWRCAPTALEADVNAYVGCEEELQQLVELATNVTSMLFSGWFGVASFYYQNNYPAGAGESSSRPSEYFIFLTSVAASLLLVKAVPRIPVHPEPVRELMALICALACAVMTTALVVAGSKVGRYAALALVPEAIALVVWWLAQPEWLQLQDGGGGAGRNNNEPASLSFLSVSFALLLAVLTYRAKDVRALSSLYDEAFVLFGTADVVAALGWRLLTQPPVPVDTPQVQAAAKILAFFTYWLLVVSVLAFMGIMFGL